MRVKKKMQIADNATPTTIALRIRMRSGMDANRHTPR